MKKVLPKVGDAIAIPVAKERYGLGVVLAVCGDQLISAFVDLVVDHYEDFDLRTLAPDSIVYIEIHGSLGFGDGWKIVGQIADFDPDRWPALEFYEVSTQELVEYDRETLEVIKCEFIGENIDNLPEHGTAGHVYVQGFLAIKLGVSES